MKRVQLIHGRAITASDASSEDQVPTGQALVSVTDFETGELILRDGVKPVARWLELCGYSWVFGSNGVWQAA